MEHARDKEIREALVRSENNPTDLFYKTMAWAIRDYLSVQGKIVQVHHVLAYYANDLDGTEGRIDINLTTPAIVKIKSTPLADISRTCDEFLDPEWNAELVEPHPSLDPNEFDVKNLTVFGSSYNTKRGTFHRNESHWSIVNPQPNNTGTLDVETITVDEPKTMEGQEKTMSKRLKLPFKLDDGMREDYRMHAANIARIIAAGLASGQHGTTHDASVRDAVKLYLDITQADTEKMP